jgi:hypothetical protein
MKTFYTTHVIGKLWMGGTATYAYKTDIMPDNIKAIAGDFQTLIDCQIERTSFTFKVEPEKTIKTETVETVRKWTLPDSEDFYMDNA